MTSFRKQLTKACNAAPEGVSFWGEIGMEPDKERMFIGKICHGAWGCYLKRKVYENISNHYNKKIPRKYQRHYREWISFVLNDSPWSGAFITKRFGVAIQHNIELRIDVHPSIAMGGIIAMRMASEMPAIMPTYAKVRRMGYSVPTAFLVATLFDYNVQEIMPYRSLHSLWDNGCCLKSIFHFMNKGFPNTLVGDLSKSCRFQVFMDSYGQKCAPNETYVEMLPSSTLILTKNAFGRDITKLQLSDLKGIAKDISAHYGG